MTTQEILSSLAIELGLTGKSASTCVTYTGCVRYFSGQTGKSIESDLATGKKTLPVLYAIGKGGRFARRWAQGPILVDEVPDMANLLEDEGAYHYTLDTAQRLTEKAYLALQQAACENPAGDALVELTELLLRRKN